ncbi:MAG: ABC transporter substrate-binding protein [Planctomycetes bacterium]|nr:ABC transporter substrate-binding protein [Planctomycetota bacterium]
MLHGFRANAWPPATLLLFLLALGIAPAARAEDGVTAEQLLLGQSCALTGPSAGLGLRMRSGLLAYFQRVNQAGGIRRRRLELVTYDDAYEPKKAEVNTERLIHDDRVFALVGEVGTPTSQVALPLCTKDRVPFVAPLTGANFLREAGQEFVVNLRASYDQEGEEMARFLVDRSELQRVACLYQSDSFGEAGLAAIRAALGRRKLELVATGNFPRNTIAIAEGINRIAEAKPEAVVMVGTYRPLATFVKAARMNEAFQGTRYLAYSFTGAGDLCCELGCMGEGVVVSQVVPDPSEPALPLVKEFQEDMRKAGKEADIGPVALEGYLAARLVCETLSRMEGEPTRAAFLQTVRHSGKYDLGGFELEFDAKDNQGSDHVFLTVLKNGNVESLK